MTIGIPKTIKDMSVYINSDFHMGDVQQIVLPKITKNIENFKTGFSSVPIELGIEPLTVSITMLEQTKNMFKLMGILGGRFADVITFRASQEGYSSSNDQNSIKITMKGIFTEIDLGTVQRGSINTYTLSATLSHFAYYIENMSEPTILIEPMTQKFILDGVDQLKTRKNALGMK